MTNPNDKVQWYDHLHGVRFRFENGYSISIIPGPDANRVECAIFDPSDKMEQTEEGDEVFYLSPDRLAEFFTSIQARQPVQHKE
jgi:hypothetical protein